MPDLIDKYNKNGLPRVLLIFGEEEFLVDEALDKIVSSAKEQSAFDFEMIDGRETTPERIVDSCMTFPFISTTRTVVVRHFDEMFSGRASKKNDEKTSLGRYLLQPLDTTTLILVGAPDSANGLQSAKKSGQKAKLDKISKAIKFPFSSIFEHHEWIEFPKVWESDFADWVQSRMKTDGYKISPDAVELLVSQTNPALRDLANELDKLKIYLKDKKNITIEDVTAVVGTSRSFNVFELQKAVGRRDLPLSLVIIENMLATDRQEMLIMTMLTRYFLTLWKLTEAAKTTTNQYALAGQVGVSSFFLNEYIAAMKRFSPAELDRAFIALSDTDQALKSSSVDSVYTIQKMLISILEK